MDTSAATQRIDRFQQRHRALALPLAVIRKFGDDEGANLAGLIAFRAFFSLFPLLLLFTTILGYVLADNPDLREEAVDSVLSQFPVIGEELRTGSLEGSGIALAIGVAGSLWAGFGVVIATERALDRVWAVPRNERPNFVTSRLRALILLVALGALTILSTVAAGLAGGGSGLLGTSGVLISLALNVILFSAVFTLLGSRQATFRQLLPGIAFGAVAWAILQLLGGYFVAHEVRNAEPTYGVFAIVLGLLIWLNIGASLLVMAAELNVIWARRLWPRSVFSNERSEDERVLTALAHAQTQDDRQRIRSEFEPREPSR